MLDLQGRRAQIKLERFVNKATKYRAVILVHVVRIVKEGGSSIRQPTPMVGARVLHVVWDKLSPEFGETTLPTRRWV